MTQSNLEACQVNTVQNENVNVSKSEWYKDIIYYLQNLNCPSHFSDSQKRTLKLHAIRYVIVQGELYWKNPDGVLLRCVDEDEANNVLNDMHKGLCGGHYTAQTTSHKILRAGYWWPTVFSDAQKLVRKCDPCQRFSRKLRYEGAFPLRIVTVDAPFQQWGIDFIGEISEKSSGGHSWILVATDYFTK